LCPKTTRFLPWFPDEQALSHLVRHQQTLSQS
jgi:hypothetical protein